MWNAATGIHFYFQLNLLTWYCIWIAYSKFFWKIWRIQLVTDSDEIFGDFSVHLSKACDPLMKPFWYFLILSVSPSLSMNLLIAVITPPTWFFTRQWFVIQLCLLSHSFEAFPSFWCWCIYHSHCPFTSATDFVGNCISDSYTALSNVLDSVHLLPPKLDGLTNNKDNPRFLFDTVAKHNHLLL